MEVTLNEKSFDDFQSQMLTEIIFDVRTALEEADIPREKIRDLTHEIAFSVATIIDGSRDMYVGNKLVLPYLTFAKDRSCEHLIATEGGSWMHEYTPELIEDSFEHPATLI